VDLKVPEKAIFRQFTDTALHFYRIDNRSKRRLTQTNARIKMPMKKGTRNDNGASIRKLNEAITNALPSDRSKRVAPMPVARVRTKRRTPEPAFPNALPSILSTA
jgi:hypothetical protein